MAKTAIGIDIGGTNIRAALVDEDGTIRQHTRIKSASDPQAVLGLIETARRSHALGEDTIRWVEEQIAQRAAARQSRDFKRADAIRDELARRGVVLEDGAGGTKWKFVPKVDGAGLP